MIRPVETRDLAALCAIYNPYVEDSIATFEEVAVTEADMAHRVAVVSRQFPWLVLEEEGAVRGFAYANWWKARSAYRHTLETTIYLDRHWRGRGAGKRLYVALLDRLLLGQEPEVRRLLACISLPNDASIALHESLGYRKIGHFSEVGYKFGRWIDVGYWEWRAGNGVPQAQTPPAAQSH